MSKGISAFDLVMPRQIAFGWGRRSELGILANRLGDRALVVLGSRGLASSRLWPSVIAGLNADGPQIVEVGTVSEEPTVSAVDRLLADVRALPRGQRDVVVAIGGGSAIDTAKALAALLPQGGTDSVADYLEGVGRGLKLEADPLPILAVPTTAGTGSEATRNAVISSYDPPFKKSLRSPQLVPQVALVDPELTTTSPPQITAHSGIDAVTQLIESYISCRATTVTRPLALAALEGLDAALLTAHETPDDRNARERMSQAALISGVTLGNGGLGIAHGVAAALGAVCGMTHGLACGVMLPVAIEINREIAHPDLARVGRAVTGRRLDDPSAVSALVDGIARLLDRLGIPRRLSQHGVRREQLSEIVRLSHGNSRNGNPREISDGELLERLEENL